MTRLLFSPYHTFPRRAKKKRKKKRRHTPNTEPTRHQPTSLSPSPSTARPRAQTNFPNALHTHAHTYTHTRYRAPGLNPLPLCANCHLYLQQARRKRSGEPAMKTQLSQELERGEGGGDGVAYRGALSFSEIQIARWIIHGGEGCAPWWRARGPREILPSLKRALRAICEA